MNDGEALYRNICTNPEDDTARLVYADWCDENGQEEYAQYVRWSIELYRMDSVSSFSGISEYKEKEKWCREFEKNMDWNMSSEIRNNILHMKPIRGMIGQVEGFPISLFFETERVSMYIPEEKVEKHQLSDWVVRLMKETPVTIIELFGIEPQRTTQYINGKAKRVFRWTNMKMFQESARIFGGILPNWLFDQIKVMPKQWDRYWMNQTELSYQILEYDTREEAKEALGYALCSHIRKLVYET
jgi:uncharacterized protein (TIGR02996 family)